MIWTSVISKYNVICITFLYSWYGGLILSYQLASVIAIMNNNNVIAIIECPVNNILMEEQHGFHSERSISTCNLVFSNFVFQSF